MHIDLLTITERGATVRMVFLSVMVELWLGELTVSGAKPTKPGLCKLNGRNDLRRQYTVN